MESILTKEDIIRYLNLINTKLEELGKAGEVLLAGGASMALVYSSRRSTHDIDAIFEPKSEIAKIASEIAEQNNLNEDWFNDGVKGFFNSTMNSEVLIELSALTVKTIDAEGLLAMKLASARPETNDQEDAKVLMKHLEIDKLENVYELLEKHIPSHRLTAQVDFFARYTFEAYQKDLK